MLDSFIPDFIPVYPGALRTCVRVSIKGSAYVNFQRALDRGDILNIRAAAAELPQINLGDALRICLAFRTSSDQDLYQRAAVRWLGRFCLEANDVRLDELEQAAVALGALPAHPEEAFAHLSDLCEDHGVYLDRRSPTADGRFRGGAG
jgi:hypothetical protein